MCAAYALYPEASRISRYRGEAYRELGEWRGGDRESLPICGESIWEERGLRRAGAAQSPSTWTGGGESLGNSTREAGAQCEAERRRRRRSTQVNHWSETISERTSNSDSCEAIALALVAFSLSYFSSGLLERKDKDKRQIGTRAIL